MDLYSTEIFSQPSSCCKLKLIKYENGFGLFHVYQTRNNKEKTTYGFGTIPAAPRPSSISFAQQTSQMSVVNNISCDDPLSLVTEYQVSVVDRDQRERIRWTACFSNSNKDQCHTIGVYISNLSKAFFNDVLILQCCMKVRKMPETETLTLDTECSLESQSLKKLSQDLKAMYQNSMNTDFTLEVETEQILVNGPILSARSSVFKKMLHHDKEQNSRCSVAITDVPLSAMKRLVEFLYTGAVEEAAKDIPFQEVYDLYYAADKYDVMDLRKMCGTTLMSKASVDKSSQILLWADRHNDADLKSQALNFIRLNFETVVDTEAWRCFADNETKLAIEALNFCAHKFKAGEDK
ncbi:speckle-type POZ protein B [Nephila pilipes]|uniref:Speckle-type POZ protein B n=1 Tax=Nephila pilipes TaxID=299642 RepID=A0A8X6QNK2_NEPPI|nr:speckle-type POZ protein B [Nephila pilipes]